MASCDKCHRPLAGRGITAPKPDEGLICERCFRKLYPGKTPMPHRSNHTALSRANGKITTPPRGTNTTAARRTAKRNVLTLPHLAPGSSSVRTR